MNLSSSERKRCGGLSMKEHRLINSWTLGALLVAAGSLSSLASAQGQTEPKRPDTPKCDQKDDYFGTTVADPYRWMEVEKTPEIQKWIEEENALTQKVLGQIPFREESVGSVLSNVPRRRGKASSRSERALRRRNGRALRLRNLERRKIRRVCDLDERLRLARYLHRRY